MDITITPDTNGCTLFALDGRLDTMTAPQLEDAVNGVFESGSRDLRVDLAKVDFVSSAGLRVIIGTQKKVMGNGSLVFCNVQSGVMDIFDMTGFSKLMTFE